MFYFFMVLWSLASIATIVLFFVWLVAKISKKPSKTKGKSTLYLLASSILFLIVSLVINGTAGDETVSTIVSNQDEEIPMILDANKFGRISTDELVKIMGEPEEKEETVFKMSETRAYDTTYYIYENGTYEFMIIDGKVVRFTMYGTGQTYKNDDEAFSLFGITPGPNITKVADTGMAIRYQNVNENVDDFWLVEDSKPNSIGTVKITYDSKYF